MKIFGFSRPYESTFARVSAVGTWVGEGWLCPECQTQKGRRRIPPFVIQWERDSDLIGDFVWVDFGLEIVITERVVRALNKENFRGFELGPVEMFQDPRLKRPKRVTQRTKPRVWLPYEGPPLYELLVHTNVPMDRDRTTATLEKKCQTCGNERFRWTGFERSDSRVVRRGGEIQLIETHKPRVPGQGLFVRKKDLHGLDIFQAQGLGGSLCTERVKTFIEKEGFTNVRFLEYGDVI